MVAVNPCAGSVTEISSTSPWLNSSVLLFGRNVLTSASCGLGGPVGTPLVCRNAKLVGSSQLGLQVAKLKLHSRLSMVSAAHHLVLLQLSLSTNGVKPGGYSCSSMNAEPAAFATFKPTLLSLSGLHG